MDCGELLQRADRYRTLATRMTDAQTRAGLLELAEKYEAFAYEMQQNGPESNECRSELC